VLIDIHVHAMGYGATQATMLAGLEEAGLDKAVILSPPPVWDSRDHEVSMRDSADWLAQAVGGAEDRLIPFVWTAPMPSRRWTTPSWSWGSVASR